MNKVTSGALWEKTTKTGDIYFSGQVEIDGNKYQVAFFKNKYKKEEKHPDWKTIADKPITDGNTNIKKDPSSDTKFDGDKFTDDTPF